jgi:hypothetical protein
MLPFFVREVGVLDGHEVLLERFYVLWAHALKEHLSRAAFDILRTHDCLEEPARKWKFAGADAQLPRIRARFRRYEGHDPPTFHDGQTALRQKDSDGHGIYIVVKNARSDAFRCIDGLA